MESFKFGVINDLHIPFQDPHSVSLVLDIYQDLEIDVLYINGDLLDFYNLSSHGPKCPDMQYNLEYELNAGMEFIKELRKRFAKSEIVLIFGNHEWRLDRFIQNNCPAFWNIVKLEAQLQLNYYNIQKVDYNEMQKVGNTSLYIQHSPPSYSENAAMTSLKKKFGASFIYGCTHRRDYACKTGVHGELYEVFMNGWLGSTDLSDAHKIAFKYTKNHNNWQQVMGLGEVMGDKYNYTQHNVYKSHGSGRYAIINGVCYEN